MLTKGTKGHSDVNQGNEGDGLYGPPPIIIMGGLNLKICQNFVGTKFFLTFMGE